ncbi:MAG: sirohydrochlorin chelatase [Gammaproteobacteria bacterium]
MYCLEKKNLSHSLLVGALSLIFSGPSASAEDEHAGHDMSASMDHSGHDMSGHSTERDELGRRLHGMKHEMSPEVIEQLRENIRGWDKISDQEIALSMEMMGTNYEWYISNDDLEGPAGVLIMLHGFRDRGDMIFKNQLQSYADVFPTALTMGMSMGMSQHIQLGLDDLVAAGAERIVVIPIVSTEYNTMIRQWQYIFGLLDEPSYAAVPRVKTEAEVIFAGPPGDDPLVAEILLDHALEFSENPQDEVVIIAAHGPSEDADNVKQLALMEKLAKIVKQDGDFADVMPATLQDDAPPKVRAANVAKLRGMVEAATADGKRVIVVTSLIGARTIQKKLRKDLDDLDYTFNPKGLVQHDLFVTWIGETIRTELLEAT